MPRERFRAVCYTHNRAYRWRPTKPEAIADAEAHLLSNPSDDVDVETEISGSTTEMLHPGVMLQNEFLNSNRVTRNDLARHIGESVSSVTKIIKGVRPVKPLHALKLAKAFGTNPQLWMNAQANYDLAISKKKRKDGLRTIGRLRKRRK